MSALTTADLVRLQRSTFEEFRSRPLRAEADDRAPMFRVGGLAFCPVTQLLRRSGVEPTLPPLPPAEEAKKQAKFEAGRAAEKEQIKVYERAGLLIAKQPAFFDPELGVRGYGDAIWGGSFRTEVPWWWEPDYRWKVQEFQQRAQDEADGRVPVTLTEIKWTASYSIEKMERTGEPAVWYRPQLACYALMARRHPENLDAPELERFEYAILSAGQPPLIFELDESDVDAVEDRIGMLGEAWSSGSWPPCECGQVEGMGWSNASTCDYGDGEGGCCNRSLLDRLTESVEATA